MSFWFPATGTDVMTTATHDGLYWFSINWHTVVTQSASLTAGHTHFYHTAVHVQTARKTILQFKPFIMSLAESVQLLNHQQHNEFNGQSSRHHGNNLYSSADTMLKFHNQTNTLFNLVLNNNYKVLAHLKVLLTDCERTETSNTLDQPLLTENKQSYKNFVKVKIDSNWKNCDWILEPSHQRKVRKITNLTWHSTLTFGTWDRYLQLQTSVLFGTNSVLQIVEATNFSFTQTPVLPVTL